MRKQPGVTSVLGAYASAIVVTLLALSAVSAAEVHNVDVVELKGRVEHEGYFPIPGQPVPGNAHLMVWLAGEWTRADFRLVDTAGQSILEVSLSPMSGESKTGNLLGAFIVPAVPFRVAVSGDDVGGTPFEQVFARLFTPQTVTVTFDEPYVRLNPTMTLQFTVKNVGDTATFDLGVSTSDGLSSELSSAETTLTSGSSSEHVATVTVDDGAHFEGPDLRVEVSVVRRGAPAVTNTAVGQILLDNLAEVFDDGFE